MNRWAALYPRQGRHLSHLQMTTGPLGHGCVWGRGCCPWVTYSSTGADLSSAMTHPTHFGWAEQADVTLACSILKTLSWKCFYIKSTHPALVSWVQPPTSGCYPAQLHAICCPACMLVANMSLSMVLKFMSIPWVHGLVTCQRRKNLGWFLGSVEENYSEVPWQSRTS